MSGGSHVEGKMIDSKLVAPQINISPDEKGEPLQFKIEKSKFGYSFMEIGTKQYITASNNNILMFGEKSKAVYFTFLKYL